MEGKEVISGPCSREVRSAFSLVHVVERLVNSGLPRTDVWNVWPQVKKKKKKKKDQPIKL